MLLDLGYGLLAIPDHGNTVRVWQDPKPSISNSPFLLESVPLGFQQLKPCDFGRAPSLVPLNFGVYLTSPAMLSKI